MTDIKNKTTLGAYRRDRKTPAAPKDPKAVHPVKAKNPIAHFNIVFGYRFKAPVRDSHLEIMAEFAERTGHPLIAVRLKGLKREPAINCSEAKRLRKGL